jgi:hypothetical protein
MGLARANAGARKRMDDLLAEAETHIICREHTTASLARALGVSVPTAARLVVHLRARLAARGGELVSVRKGRSWHYEIREKEEWLAKIWSTDPLLKAVGSLRGPKRSPGQSVDDIIYNGM